MNLGSEREGVDPGHRTDQLQSPGEDPGLLICVSIFCGYDASLPQPSFCSLLSPRAAAWAPISQDERELEAEIARILHGFISQGLSLKGQERLADERASWIKHAGRRINPDSRGI